ncbi:hypothetical protein B4N89_04780 [Embleya scabrispora]|uniref:DUF397 domain-containing protein n=1 Tax=Embleya scabrispora TaxID=159449 RepID=A0A1T3NU01_9ACTN|nr:DUF397 domain-containing protein [Embleya scabrispora]OPC80353.1 hypothetical protein B4N89_04780 [Embleya scabrispora]
MTRERIATGTWRKSSYSGNQGGDCVEVAPLTGAVGVRDSKVGESPIVRTRAEAWAAFLDSHR